jgi:hypothetical protein
LEEDKGEPEAEGDIKERRKSNDSVDNKEEVNEIELAEAKQHSKELDHKESRTSKESLHQKNELSDDVDTSRFSHDKLEAFQKEFPDASKEDLARYLIGRNNHLKKAKEQLIRAKEKREELNLPILKSSVMNEMSTGKIYCHGVDKEGRPVLVWIASKNCVSKRNLDETMRLLIWWAEYTIREKLPPGKSKVTVLVHMDGTSNDNVDKELYKECLSLFQVFCSF